MPTYEYACKSCGEHIEVVQSFKDDPLRTCPTCEGDLRKVFGAIGIAFKGSGFYKTDSRGGAAKSEPSKTESAASTSTSPSTSTDSSSSSGSDSKSAAAS